MLIVLTPALRSYLQQRSEIEELKSQKVTTQKAVNKLEAEKKQWRSEAYVKKQAEQRLGYAMPGKSITVYVDDSNKTHAVQKRTGVANVTSLSDRPWYGQIWGSLSRSSDAEK